MKAFVLAILLVFGGSALAQGFEASPVLRGQILLDRNHFAVGEIDGTMGPTTEAAIRQFQKHKNIPLTSTFDVATMQALEDGTPMFRQYTLSEQDVKGKFGPRPLYATVHEKLGEIFQISPRLLKQLNPNATFTAGETVIVPDVGGALTQNIAKIVVTKSEESFMVYNSAGALVAYYPTTLGDDSSIPFGEHTIKATTRNPYYKRKLPDGSIRAMSPGPNNYVGDIWMALSAKHYGIHGSPEPNKIAKQESAGCIRLTNWDAHEVAAAIDKNAVVIIQE